MPSSSFFLEFTRGSDQRGAQRPPIYGEAQEAGFEGAIEIKSWKWDFSEESHSDQQTGNSPSNNSSGRTSSPPGNNRPNQSRSSGKPNPTSVHFDKATDASTPLLLQAMVDNEIFDAAVFTLRQKLRRIGPDGKYGDLEFRHKLHLRQAKITSYQLSASASGDGIELQENWEMSYTELWVTYGEVGSSMGEYTSAYFQPEPNTPARSPQTNHPSPQDQERTLRQYEERLQQLERELRRRSTS